MNIFNNIQLKLLAVFTALLLWLFVVGVENYVYIMPIEIPVKVINLGQNVSIANELSKVKVRYKAQDEAGKNINSNEFELFVDAGNLSEGIYGLDVNYISKNPRITVISVEPSQINLNLEAIASKEILLKAELVGKPAKDFEVKEFKLSQEKIKIGGAASLLNNINELNIKINLDGTEKADFSRKIAPEAPADWNLNGKTISFDPSVIQADIKVRHVETANNTTPPSDSLVTENQIKKTFMVQVDKQGEAASSIKELLPQNILVTLSGDKEIITKLLSNQITLKLDTARVKNGVYIIDKSDIVWPGDIKLNVEEFSPEQVLVKF